MRLQYAFQFTPVLRRATPGAVRNSSHTRFNSRPSCDGRRIALIAYAPWIVSIHARLATGDRGVDLRRDCARVSIHARLATGDALAAKHLQHLAVSIHARLATGDITGMIAVCSGEVSIHARLATGDRDNLVNYRNPRALGRSV